MKFLLDTHALIWWLSDDRRLGARARALIADPNNTIFVSVVSLWEIVVKLRIGKLEADIGAIERAVLRNSFDRLAITAEHLRALVDLPQHHRDPFDHLLLAQAMHEGAVFVSEDPAMPLYPITLQRCGG
jgi:PIN domain nuclease of toxin-antitoxin system